MKRVLTVALAVSLLLAACAPSGTPLPTEGAAASSATPSVPPTEPPPDPPSEPPAAEPEIPSEPQTVNLTIDAPSLQNNLIGESPEQGISVYLPAGYDGGDWRYPVLYWLPGHGDSYLTQISFFAGALTNRDIRDMIVVAVNGQNKLNGSFYANSPVTGNWEDFVTQDVISYIDSHYRTIADSAGRGIAGHSMGGSGVADIVLNKAGVFDYAYSLSPGLFDEDGLSMSPMNFGALERFIEPYLAMDKDEAAAEYARQCATFSWPKDFYFGYASAFAPDVEGQAPYIKLPQQENRGDEVWSLYDAGFGNLREKLDKGGAENLKQLKKFTIEYGEQDFYRYIINGCEYFSRLLTERDIAHELVTFEGGHEDKVRERVGEAVIPFFLEAFGG